CSSIIACCTGCRSGTLASFRCEAYHAGIPSRVVTGRLPTAESGVIHERVSTPLIRTEQEPHWPRPQPNRGPLRFKSLDRTYNSGVSGAADTVRTCSFTRILVDVAMTF